MSDLQSHSSVVQSTVSKPWGSYTDHYRSERCVFKIIQVAANQRLSIQRHEQREEIWVVLSGSGYVEVDHQFVMGSWIAPRRFFVQAPNRVEFIQKGQVHRLCAGPDGIVIAELQVGVCLESDIVRLQDDYGRTG